MPTWKTTPLTPCCTALILSTALIACGDADDASDETQNNAAELMEIELRGTWVSNFGEAYTIDEGRWGADALVDYDNRDNWAILELPADAEFNPGTFSRVVWTEPEAGSWWFCTVDFGLESAQAARDSGATADPTTPAESGCGGFAWTQMLEPIAVTGIYTNQFDGVETITPTTWGFAGLEQTITRWDNDANWAITQNPDDAEFSPGSFNKIVWLDPDADGTFFYCTVDFGLETEAQALDSAATADAAAPLERGCGQAPWTQLTPTEG